MDPKKLLDLPPDDPVDPPVRERLVRVGMTLDQERDAVDDSGVYRWVRDLDGRATS